uniref:LO7 n=1 Tax=Barramundi adomavirus TaxID=2609870 RepID=A0A6F9EY49_9VIRU|nr:TPA_asm: LO7 [Barramundi adomavirus]
MTTTDEQNSFDRDLSITIQDNMREFHIAGPLTTAAHTREASEIGPSAVSVLNQDGPGDVTMELDCPKGEAILVGSLFWVGDGKIRVFTAANNTEVTEWQTTSSGSGTAFTIRQGSNDPITIPCFFANNQFTQVDMQIGHTQSVNRHLPLVSSSECGAGGLAALNFYLNDTGELGYYALNCTSATGTTHRHNLQVTNQAGIFNFMERVYHQTNNSFNMLCSWDYDDHHTRKCFPRGMSMKIKCATRPYMNRVCVARTHDTTNYAIISFTSFKLKYTTVTIPDDGHRDAEPEQTVFATLDMGVRGVDLAVNQRAHSFSVTNSSSDFVPQLIFAYVAPQGSFNTINMRDTHAGLLCVPNAIRSVRCNLNGDLSPDFMSIYHDSTVNLLDAYQRSTMFNCYLGRLGMMQGKSRKYERSLAESHILSYSGQGNANTRNQMPATQGVLLVTDPSMALVREASSGAITGKLTMMFEFNPEAIVAGSKLIVFCTQKHQVYINKIAEFDSAPAQYQLDKLLTRPAFSTLSVGSVSRKRKAEEPLDPDDLI